MDLRKILILGVLLVVVFSAAGAVSAGLFDFGDDSFTLKGELKEGYVEYKPAGETDDNGFLGV